MKSEIVLAAVAALGLAGGCIQVKTESEIKPIHITMDINLKVDKDLDKAFADESQQKPEGDYKIVKALLDRRVAGITNRAMIEERAGATDADRLTIADENAKRMKRFSEIAKTNGTSIEVVQKRYAARMREKIAAGIWYQDDSGAWQQKK